MEPRGRDGVQVRLCSYGESIREVACFTCLSSRDHSIIRHPTRPLYPLPRIKVTAFARAHVRDTPGRKLLSYRRQKASIIATAGCYFQPQCPPLFRHGVALVRSMVVAWLAPLRYRSLSDLTKVAPCSTLSWSLRPDFLTHVGFSAPIACYRRAIMPLHGFHP